MKIAWKTIKGHGPYAYLQETVRTDRGTTVSKHVAYLGKAAKFPPGLKITANGGSVKIPKIPQDVFDELTKKEQKKIEPSMIVGSRGPLSRAKITKLGETVKGKARVADIKKAVSTAGEGIGRTRKRAAAVKKDIGERAREAYTLGATTVEDYKKQGAEVVDEFKRTWKEGMVDSDPAPKKKKPAAKKRKSPAVKPMKTKEGRTIEVHGKASIGMPHNTNPQFYHDDLKDQAPFPKNYRKTHSLESEIDAWMTDDLDHHPELYEGKTYDDALSDIQDYYLGYLEDRVTYPDKSGNDYWEMVQDTEAIIQDKARYNLNYLQGELKEAWDADHFFSSVGGFVKDYFDEHYEPSGKEGEPVGFDEGDILEYLEKETSFFDEMQTPKTDEEINDAHHYIGHYFGNEMWDRIPEADDEEEEAYTADASPAGGLDEVEKPTTPGPSIPADHERVNVAKTPVQIAHSWAERQYQLDGKDLKKDLPNFKKNYNRLIAATSKALDIPRGEMPVIEPEDILQFNADLRSGRIDLFPPYARGQLFTPVDLPVKELNEKWIDLGFQDGNIQDDVAGGVISTMPAKAMIPTQSEIFLNKLVSAALQFGPAKQDTPVTEATIIVSSDGYILDGHHRYGQAMLSNPNLKMKVLKLPVPIDTLLKVGRTYTDYLGREVKAGIE